LDWREHPLLALAGLILILLATVYLLGRGCGCWNRARAIADAVDKAANKTATGKTAAGKAKKEWMDDCAEPPNWGKEEQKPKPAAAKPAPAPVPRVQPTASDDGEGGIPARPQKSSRPVDLGRWSPEDFFTAQRENDPRLIEAVAYLGKHFATKEGAEFLAKLLEPPSLDPAARRAPTSPALIETVIAALMSNGTATAREILGRLVAGTQETIEPELAATAALKALLQRPGKANEDLLFSVVTFPEQTAATDRKAIDRSKLRAVALEWVKESASEAFRLRLANAMIAADTPPAAFEQIWGALSDARIENLAAQITIYRSDRLPDRVKESLERQFAEQSRGELRRLLGCVPPDQLHSASDGVDASDGSCRVAELLWTPSFARLVEMRLRAAEGSEQGPRLLWLACTIPNSALRATVLQSMEQYWDEGPKRVEPFAASEESLPEPGFLLLVKQLPRKDVPAAAANSNAGEGKGSSVSRLPVGKAAKIAAARQAKDRQGRTAQQWLGFCEKLAQTMCRQFRAAALGRTDAEQIPAEFPVKLPPNMAVAAAHHAEWSEEFPRALGKLHLPPLRVYYVRIERKARPDKVAAYFRNQLHSAVRHVSDHGVWFDDFNLDKRKGNMRSVDVFIGKPNKDVGIVLDQEQQVTVELLAVEALPPRDGAAVELPPRGKQGMTVQLPSQPRVQLSSRLADN